MADPVQSAAALGLPLTMAPSRQPFMGMEVVENTSPHSSFSTTSSQYSAVTVSPCIADAGLQSFHCMDVNDLAGISNLVHFPCTRVLNPNKFGGLLSW